MYKPRYCPRCNGEIEETKDGYRCLQCLLNFDPDLALEIVYYNKRHRQEALDNAKRREEARKTVMKWFGYKG